jgi:hypothetical protein
MFRAVTIVVTIKVIEEILDRALVVVLITELECVGRTGLHTGWEEVPFLHGWVFQLPSFLALHLEFSPADTLYAEGAPLHDSTTSHGYVGVQLVA